MENNSSVKGQPRTRITVMQSGGQLTDMRLTCHHETFYVHKWMLAAHSSYLREHFKREPSKIRETKDELFTISMNKVQPLDVTNILKYIYNGEIPIRGLEKEGFRKAADILGIEIDGLNAKSPSNSKVRFRLPEESSMKSNEKNTGENSGLLNQFSKSEPDETFKKPEPLGKSSKSNKKIGHRPHRVSRLVDTSGPRPPTPHPKTDTENRARVFYITPMVEKIQQMTLTESH